MSQCGQNCEIDELDPEFEGVECEVCGDQATFYWGRSGHTLCDKDSCESFMFDNVSSDESDMSMED